MGVKLFKDRTEAGQLLAEALKSYQHQPNIVVLALPRGGVPVAFEVAQALHAPLDVLLVRKLGAPCNEELAIGAIAHGNIRVLNEDTIDHLHVSQNWINSVTERERTEIERREKLYREGRTPMEVKGKTVILIDDGVATGATIIAALQTLRTQNPEQIIVAVPVAPPSICDQLARAADAVICLVTPEWFYGVSQWYEDFSQTSDEDVIMLLHVASAGSFPPNKVPQAARDDYKPWQFYHYDA